MNRKQLDRIATALEQIASQQATIVGAIENMNAKADQDLATHAKMFESARSMLEPILVAAAQKMLAKTEQPEAITEPSAQPVRAPEVTRGGIRIAAASPTEIEVPVE